MGSAESGSALADDTTGVGLDDENAGNGADKVVDERRDPGVTAADEEGRGVEVEGCSGEGDDDVEVGRVSPDVARCFLRKKESVNLILMQAV